MNDSCYQNYFDLATIKEQNNYLPTAESTFIDNNPNLNATHASK